MADLDAVVHGAAEAATATGGLGSDDPAGIVENGAIAVVDGAVAAVGPTDEVTREYPPENAAHEVDASGRAVIPGYVDSHTHACFAGDRSDEFEAKLRGTTYGELLANGGGIHRTVRATRAAGDDELLGNLLDHLDVMLTHGTTTVEVKSGYGLDTETELRMLDVVDRADDRHPVDVIPTFMGAHAVPRDYEGSGDPVSDDDYVDRVVDEQLPAVADQGIAEFCDVFCDEGAFTVDQSRRVLRAGAECGLTPKVHAEELAHRGGAKLAAEVGAASADHLLHATDEDVAALVEAGVAPVLLPGTAFGLGADYADARAMVEAGAPVAVATDFNPNCHSQSMGFASALACVEMGLTPAEALVAGTRNGARALDRPDLGVVREGAPADLVVLDAPSHVHVPYSYGINRVATVLKDGRPVVGPEWTGSHDANDGGSGGETDV
ncbi:imidazolonepropionase [Halosimplex carlsbadense 2-9-1]|uniref:Imidazolonepropionase n=1 Tax=Halosimplex carlsbadense 2-9-1 TaxID=797114 RepID=M0CCA8_9EURY|nr:imidazolonepropionase [Halosimplex carlsbadense]ELZ20278.1 imidazolonepropionase [Halosimplex carlsbadense 2-9-1]